jgi:hypothetical protein
VLFGQFLLLKKDKDLFVEWLKEEIGASSQHATGKIIIGF